MSVADSHLSSNSNHRTSNGNHRTSCRTSRVHFRLRVEIAHGDARQDQFVRGGEGELVVVARLQRQSCGNCLLVTLCIFGSPAAGSHFNRIGGVGARLHNAHIRMLCTFRGTGSTVE